MVFAELFGFFGIALKIFDTWAVVCGEKHVVWSTFEPSVKAYDLAKC